MAQIKIRSNPYTREIEYYQNGEEIGKADPNSRLCEIDKKSNFLPFHAKEIVDLILDAYYSGEKVEVVFEGTDEELCELRKVCSADDIADKILLIKGQDSLENAQSIMVETKELFETVKPIIEKILNDDSDIRHDIKLVSDALDDIIPICVFGNYSSGKSTFINALIGNEVLPSGGDPVTAKIYEIKRSERSDFAQVRFTYHDDPICVTIEDATYTIDGVDSDLVQKLKADLAELDSDELFVVINKAIEIINAHEKVDQETIDISSIIKVEVPFSNHGILGQSKNKFVIFDTPGSNSASNADHTAVLKEALTGFSNGIPVWVSQYDSLDSTDNENLCDMLLELKALDNRFTVIVVNKADVADIPENGFSKKKEKEILEYNSVEKMYASGVFFVSSVLGLGAKHEGKLHDKHYRKIYRTLKDIYEDPEDEDYTNLYRYNIMPDQIKKDMCRDSADCPNLMYANSGLFGIERQMEIFGVKYSAYNKCQMAYSFLSEAIENTARIIEEETASLKKLKQAHEAELEEKERELLLEIAALVAEREIAFGQEAKISITDFVTEQLNYSYDREELEELDKRIAQTQAEVTDLADHKDIAEQAEANVWRRFSENLREVIPSKSVTMKGTVSELFQGLASSKAAKKEWDEAQRELDSQTSDLVISYVAEDYRKNFMEAKLRISLSTGHNWKTYAEQLKKVLIEKVTHSDSLTDEQRERLSGIIVDYQPLNFNDDADDVFIKTKFLRGNFLGIQTSERLNIRRLATHYNEQMSKNIMAMAQMINESRAVTFKGWMTKLVAAIENNIVDLNPELRAKADTIKKEADKIAEYDNDQSVMKKALDGIRKMMEWKTVDTGGV